MLRKLLGVSSTLALAISIAGAADTAPTQVNISAAEIVNKNIEARGGLQAWRAVKTISMEGKLGAGGNQRAPVPEPFPGKKQVALPTDSRPKEEVQLPFIIEMQRPRKERIELQFNGQTALQVFDGVNGWKLRPYLNRREIENFTTDELKASAKQAELDGYLVDYASKGTRVELEGMEKVEDRQTYRLKLTLKNEESLHIWIDAQTFLETKIEGQPRRLDGVEHPVEVYYRNYRPVSGLQIPFALETRVLPVATPTAKLKSDSPVQEEKINIEKVTVNPNLDASLFSKPRIDGTSNH